MTRGIRMMDSGAELRGGQNQDPALLAKQSPD